MLYRKPCSSVLALAFALALLSACENGSVEPVKEPLEYHLSPLEADLLGSSNSLAGSILPELSRLYPSDNILISPFSVGMGLGMLYNASGEPLRADILNALDLRHFDERDLNKTFNGLASYLNILGNQMDMVFINGLWYPQGLRTDEDCRSRIMAYYDADLEGLDFGKTASWSYINKWAGFKSNGKIPLLTASALKEGSACIINAASVGLNWAFAFDPELTRPEEFQLNPGRTLQVAMMHAPAMPVLYSRGPDAEYLALPVGRGSLVFAAILPSQELALEQYLESFSTLELEGFLSMRDTTTMSVRMPRFTLDFQGSLNAVLQRSGVRNLGAEARPMGRLLSADKLLSDLELQHKATLILSEKGLIKVLNPLPEENPISGSIALNRPFLFAIIETNSGAVLFAGIVRNPGFVPSDQPK